MTTPRLCAYLNTILGLSAIAAAFFIEYVLNQVPCHLCMMQRLVVYALIVLSLLIMLINPRQLIARCFQGICLLLALMGMGLSGRHLYLQSLPDELKPSCGPGFDYLIQHAPFLQVIETAIKGNGECAQIQGLFLGYPLPSWTLLLFIIMGIVSFIGAVRQ